jgi:hypothetical protein
MKHLLTLSIVLLTLASCLPRDEGASNAIAFIRHKMSHMKLKNVDIARVDSVLVDNELRRVYIMEVKCHCGFKFNDRVIMERDGITPDRDKNKIKLPHKN